MPKLINELQNLQEKEEQELSLKILHTKALLEKNEAERTTVLKNLGLASEIYKSEEAQEKIINKEKVTKQYEGKVFHINEIKQICMKYDLRFLSTKYYKGSISKE